ncbi:MAG: CDP-alcohol phosphatidyltransferase family protein [Candidatus Nitronauta litoralis]|uniref:CDP-alcohol phosphatidyltransferase family protein n=1 Tax=Candidatus Nitronauta litoralis TaxID=2705533 RepID=A0A7T0G0T7_9BACT|nr:MAG: CDP-alcohol phosphatidyltransferase family protein [Candidatus Nitronauta litoralis]
MAVNNSKDEITSHVLDDLVEPINRYAHVPIAGALVKPLTYTPITPNQVTLVSVLFGLAAAWEFSLGNVEGLLVGGLLFEASLILDCVDGQLARAKNMASDLGRLIDGVGGYIANLGVVVGIGLGFSETIPTLFGLTFITILRAIAYDYSKQAMTARIKDGEDWAQMEQDKIESQMKSTPSVLLTLYHGYLRFQRMVFEGRSGAANSSKKSWPTDQRIAFYKANKKVLSLWKWNGPDLVFFIMALGGVTGSLPALLLPLTIIAAAQLILTLYIHNTRIRYETSS